MNIEKGLAALAAEDFSKVIRITRLKLKQLGKPVLLSDDEADTALRQYYALLILECPRQHFAISSIVDDYWHFHVLDTREYRNFCRRVYGFFADHVPLDPESEIDFREVRAVYIDTRELLVKHFGDEVSPKAYPVVTRVGRDTVICWFCSFVTADGLRAAA